MLKTVNIRQNVLLNCSWFTVCIGMQLYMHIFFIHKYSFSDSFSLSGHFRSVTQSCPTLCDPMNCSMPGVTVHHQLPEFTQTHVHYRLLQNIEYILCARSRSLPFSALTFAFLCMHVQSLSHIQLFGTPWTVAHQVPLSMGFPRQEYWVGCHFLLQGIFPTPGSSPHLPQGQVHSSPLSHMGSLHFIFFFNKTQI